MLSLNINGANRTVRAAPGTPLLWVLRDELNLTGTKFGCGVAACGACTVHVDGAAVRSCVMPLSALSGKKVRTIEGLGDATSTDTAGSSPRPALPDCCLALAMVPGYPTRIAAPRPPMSIPNSRAFVATTVFTEPSRSP